jgi:CheY-like chemotaxis protein
MGLSNVTEFFSDGQEVIDKVKVLTDQALAQTNPKTPPVHILLLDYQMPKKNGLDVVCELKAYFKELTT